MSIRLAVSSGAACALAVCFATVAPGEAKAQANVLKECGSQYQAAKAANELKGQSWQDFLKACRARIAEPKAQEPAPAVAAPTPAPAPAPTTAAPAPTTAAPANPLKPAAPAATAPAAAPPAAEKTAAPAKPVSEGQAAMRARQKKCGEEWKAQKAELKKKDPNLKWPQYWSECNKRLKAAGQ